MRKLASFVILGATALVFSVTVVHAQDELRSVQEELRRRSLYFGDVNGRDSAELQEATKRYQQRKGFAATGRPDRETLKSLGLVPRGEGEAPPQELTWPQEPVLPSDEKIDSVAVAAALKEETGIAPGAVVPKKLAARANSSAAQQRADNSAAPAAAPVAAATGEKPVNSPVITPSELVRFANDYFAAMGRNNPKRQLGFYADKVNYYGNGLIDRRIIEQTMRRYQARWPNRRYRMGNEIRYSPINARGEIVMTFPVTFTLKDGKRTVKGQTDNRLAISAATVDPRIVSISEHRVRR